MCLPNSDRVRERGEVGRTSSTKKGQFHRSFTNSENCCASHKYTKDDCVEKPNKVKRFAFLCFAFLRFALLCFALLCSASLCSTLICFALLLRLFKITFSVRKNSVSRSFQACLLSFPANLILPFHHSTPVVFWFFLKKKSQNKKNEKIAQTKFEEKEEVHF